MSKYTETVVPMLNALLIVGWEITSLASNGAGTYEVIGGHDPWYVELHTAPDREDEFVLGRGDFGGELALTDLDQTVKAITQGAYRDLLWEQATKNEATISQT